MSLDFKLGVGNFAVLNLAAVGQRFKLEGAVESIAFSFLEVVYASDLEALLPGVVRIIERFQEDRVDRSSKNVVEVLGAELSANRLRRVQTSRVESTAACLLQVVAEAERAESIGSSKRFIRVPLFGVEARRAQSDDFERLSVAFRFRIVDGWRFGTRCTERLQLEAIRSPSFTDSGRLELVVVSVRSFFDFRDPFQLLRLTFATGLNFVDFDEFDIVLVHCFTFE